MQRLFDMNQNTLTALGVLTSDTYGDSAMIETINYALCTCQHIQRLVFKLPVSSQGDLRAGTNLNLTHLSLEYDSRGGGLFGGLPSELFVRHLSSFLASCPRLEMLLLESKDLYTKSIAKQVLILIHDQCPNIKQILIHSGDNLQKCKESIMDNTYQPTDAMIKLDCLPEIEMQVSLLLYKLQTTLAVLDISIHGVQADYDMWKNIADHGGLPNLRELHLQATRKIHLAFYERELEYDSDEDSYQLREEDSPYNTRDPDTEAATVATIIGMSPSLRIIRLDSLNLNPDIFATLSRLRGLHRLDLFACSGFNRDDLNCFWQHNGNIQEFAFYDKGFPWKERTFTTQDILKSIADSPHKTLRKLELKSCWSYNSNDAEHFAEKMKQSQLSRIILDGCYPKHGRIAPLFTLPTLVYIKLQYSEYSDCTLNMDQIMELRQEHICAVVQIKRKGEKIYIRDFGGQFKVHG